MPPKQPDTRGTSFADGAAVDFNKNSGLMSLDAARALRDVQAVYNAGTKEKPSSSEEHIRDYALAVGNNLHAARQDVLGSQHPLDSNVVGFPQSKTPENYEIPESRAA
ncbi:hypothetical protein KBD87_01180 [Candidatus Saccharibacteria bacterium]|nr:hypothetical protein [Candidatus Saccharibacteria bacterium]